MSYIDLEIPCNYVEANLIVGYLRQCGVDCFLNDEYSAASLIAPSIVTARIMVNEKDFHHAKYLVEQFLKDSANSCRQVTNQE